MTPKVADSKGRIPTSIKIDQELWKQAKIEAINRNMELSELVENALRKDIEKVKGMFKVKEK